MAVKCDSCSETLASEADFPEHNARAYVQHVFNNERDDAIRIRIIQNYIDNYTSPIQRSVAERT